MVFNSSCLYMYFVVVLLLAWRLCNDWLLICCTVCIVWIFRLTFALMFVLLVIWVGVWVVRFWFTLWCFRDLAFLLCCVDAFC